MSPSDLWPNPVHDLVVLYSGTPPGHYSTKYLKMQQPSTVSTIFQMYGDKKIYYKQHGAHSHQDARAYLDLISQTCGQKKEEPVNTHLISLT
jgi:hypothetical protein